MTPISQSSVIAMMLVALMVTGCTTPGSDGFPDPETATMPGGTLESARAIRTIRTGMNKAQVRNLLGNPHFSEGFFNVRQWNYLFDLARQNASSRMHCQMQLTFNEAQRVKDLQWRTSQCAQRFSVIQAEPIAGQASVYYFGIPMGGLMTEEGGLSPESREVLQEFIDEIQHHFRAPVLSISSYPTPQRYRAQRQAIQAYLRQFGSDDIHAVTLSENSGLPCRNLGIDDGCRQLAQVVIEVRER